MHDKEMDHTILGKKTTLVSLSLANPEAPERRELRRTGGVERVGWVGNAGMIRPDIDLADHAEPRVFKGGK